MIKDAEFWIKHLNLQKHPEGGYYKEVYRSSEILQKDKLPQRYSGDRNYSTSIYFLLSGSDFSSFHRIKSDEIWHYYQGSSFIIYMIDENGQLIENRLGPDLLNKEQLQLVISGGLWFAAKLVDPNSYGLVGCTVSPGFHFDDFEVGNRKEMMAAYPQCSNIICELTF